MLEISGNNSSCILYERMKTVMFGALCKWKLKKKLARTPVNLIDGDMYSLFCLFSPNLQYVIDIHEGDYCIKHVVSGEIRSIIPKEFIELPKDEAWIIMQTKFVCFETDDMLRLIDMHAKDPIEEVIEIGPNNEYIKEVASGTIPFFDIKPYRVNPQTLEAAKGGNLFMDKLEMPREDAINRLKRQH